MVAARPSQRMRIGQAVQCCRTITSTDDDAESPETVAAPYAHNDEDGDQDQPDGGHPPSAVILTGQPVTRSHLHAPAESLVRAT